MKQSRWKKNIESIEAELLKRGREKNAPEILKLFSNRLSSVIKKLFSNPTGITFDQVIPKWDDPIGTFDQEHNAFEDLAYKYFSEADGSFSLAL